MASHLALARQIACPVVLISSVLDIEHKPELAQQQQQQQQQQRQDFYMVSSISYVNLEPLILSTAFLKTSKTAAAALSNKRMAVSMLSFHHLEAVKKLENQTGEKDQLGAVENLSQCGFISGRLNSGLLYIKDSLLALGLTIFERTELDQYIVVLAKVEETATTESLSKSASQEPLIRYNRLYATIDQDRLSQGNERYPV